MGRVPALSGCLWWALPRHATKQRCHHTTELVQEFYPEEAGSKRVKESRSLEEAGRCEGREAREKKRQERKLGTRRGRRGKR